MNSPRSNTDSFPASTNGLLKTVPLPHGQVLAPHLMKILKDWHANYPDKQPLGSCRKSWDNKLKSKVFSRDGEQLSVTRVPVIRLSRYKKPLKYEMLVLHAANNPDKFVVCVRKVAFIFYKEWLGGHSYGDVSAVRVFNDDLDKIVFSPDLFSKVTGDELPQRTTILTSAAIPSFSWENQNTSRASKRRAVDNVSESSRSVSDRVLQSGRGLRGQQNIHRGLDDDSERVTNETLTPTTGAATVIIFRLVLQELQITRCFPFEECSSASDFFRKSEEFFSIIDKRMKARILSCKIPGSPERRYIFDKSHEEFDLLIKEVKALAQHNGDNLVIEVTCMA